jgi:curved DNA-binding protein CbpA
MSSRQRRDPYIVLGVARHASGEDIARAYRRAARSSHPDSGSAGSAERFQAVSDAYEVLRDPGRRAMYDRSHPPALPRTPGGRGGSVRYAVPGSQHLVLGRPVQSESEPARPQPPVGDIDEAPFVLEPGEIEELFRFALSMLRARW